MLTWTKDSKLVATKGEDLASSVVDGRLGEALFLSHKAYEFGHDLLESGERLFSDFDIIRTSKVVLLAKLRYECFLQLEVVVGR